MDVDKWFNFNYYIPLVALSSQGNLKTSIGVHEKDLLMDVERWFDFDYYIPLVAPFSQGI